MSTQDHIDELIGKVLAGEAVADEVVRVEEWCALSPENLRYFNHLKTIFEKAARATDLSTYDTDAAWLRVRAQLTVPKRTWFDSPLLRIAAGVTLLSIAGIWGYRQWMSPVSTLEISSAETLVEDSLPDGTRVVLNKQTEISVSYNSNKKKGRIKLKGEANFTIKHEPDKELIVEVEEILIRDIGTVFNVKAYPESNRIEVTVQEGEVQFYTTTQKGIFIKAGRKGVYNKLDNTFVSEEADTNVIAYQTRQFVFEEEELQAVVEQLNTIYEKKLRIADNLKHCKVTVNFNNEDVDTIAEILAETLGLQITTTETEVVLEGDGCE